MKTACLPAMLVRPSVKSLGYIAGFFVLLPIVAPAQATWYLNVSQPVTENWNTLADWSANSTAPLGASPTSISSQDVFNTNGKTLRTVNGTTSTFGGARLDLKSQLSLKASTTTIGNLKAMSGAAINAQDADSVADTTLILNITSFDATAETRFAAAIANSRSLAVNITTLAGSGDFVFGKSAGGTVTPSLLTFQATNTTGYTGNIYLFGTNSSLTFTQNLTSGGGLFLNTGSILTLNNNRSLTFTGLSIGGTALTPGTYTFSQLNTDYDSYFANGGSGSITILGAIPEPASYALLLAAFAGVAVIGSRRKRRAPPPAGTALIPSCS